MLMLYKYAGMTNREIGRLYNCDYSTVSQARKQIVIKAEKDEGLKKKIEYIEFRLSRIKI
jgi:chromosomal replication initiation ATPase DnaA